MNPFVDRMIRAAKLDVRLYEEVEADKSALFQSMMVVVLSSVPPVSESMSQKFD